MYAIDQLIYLDPEFISAKFEESTGESPPTQLTRVEGMKAGASVPFFSAGVHTQETRTFNVSAQRMLQTTATALSKYPQVDTLSFENYRGTTVGWLSGILSVGEWMVKGTTDASVEGFELLQNGKRIALLLNPTYLSAGFDAIAKASEALKVNIGIPVKALVRILWRADRAETVVACPYVIFENAA